MPVDITPHYDVVLVDVGDVCVSGVGEVAAYVGARDVLGKSKWAERDRSVVGAGAVVEKHGLHVFVPGVSTASREEQAIQATGGLGADEYG